MKFSPKRATIRYLLQLVLIRTSERRVRLLVVSRSLEQAPLRYLGTFLALKKIRTSSRTATKYDRVSTTVLRVSRSSFFHRQLYLHKRLSLTDEDDDEYYVLYDSYRQYRYSYRRRGGTHYFSQFLKNILRNSALINPKNAIMHCFRITRHKKIFYE